MLYALFLSNKKIFLSFNERLKLFKTFALKLLPLFCVLFNLLSQIITFIANQSSSSSEDFIKNLRKLERLKIVVSARLQFVIEKAYNKIILKIMSYIDNVFLFIA